MDWNAFPRPPRQLFNFTGFLFYHAANAILAVGFIMPKGVKLSFLAVRAILTSGEIGDKSGQRTNIHTIYKRSKHVSGIFKFQLLCYNCGICLLFGIVLNQKFTKSRFLC